MPVRQSTYSVEKNNSHAYGTITDMYPKVRAAIVKRNDIQKSMASLTLLIHRMDFREQRVGKDTTYAVLERRADMTRELLTNLKGSLQRIERSMNYPERLMYQRHTGVKL